MYHRYLWLVEVIIFSIICTYISIFFYVVIWDDFILFEEKEEHQRRSQIRWTTLVSNVCAPLLLACFLGIRCFKADNRVAVTPSRAAPGDPELQKLVREAAIIRAASDNSRKFTTRAKKTSNRRSRRTRDASIVELSRRISQRQNRSLFADDQTNALATSSLVYTDGVTVFRIIPTLPLMEEASSMLERIAHEFLPIIKQRGYRVQSVSEYYSEHDHGLGYGSGRDYDGLDYELGGQNRSVGPSQRVQGHEMSNTLGYNSIIPSGRGFEPDHRIHLRLRHPDNVDIFRTYDEVVHTMAHELAHCVHRNHGESFFELMKTILKEYKYRLDHKDRFEMVEEVDFSGYDSDDWYLYD